MPEEVKVNPSTVTPKVRVSRYVMAAILLVTVGTAGVVAMSYFGWQSSQQYEADKASLQTQVGSLQRQLETAQKALEEAKTASIAHTIELKMPEIGVVMVLPNGLNDLSYARLTTTAASPSSVRVGFTTASLLAACGSSSSQCAATQSPLGVLARFEQSKRPKDGYGSGKLLATLGGFDFVYTEGTKLASSPAAQSIQLSQSGLIQTTIPKISLLK